MFCPKKFVLKFYMSFSKKNPWQNIPPLFCVCHKDIKIHPKNKCWAEFNDMESYHWGITLKVLGYGNLRERLWKWCSFHLITYFKEWLLKSLWSLSFQLTFWRNVHKQRFVLGRNFSSLWPKKSHCKSYNGFSWKKKAQSHQIWRILFFNCQI
jgi:hypothetical protein